jgi:hypothetical protein
MVINHSVSVKMLLNKVACGVIIGKAGAVIKEIQAASSTLKFKI